MLSRFKTSLFQPANISDYQKDSKLNTIIYFLILVLLITIPSVILIFSTSGLSFSTKTNIRNSFESDKINPFNLINYELVKVRDSEDDNYKITLENDINIIFSEQQINEIEYQPVLIGALIVFSKDVVLYHSNLVDTVKIEYRDIGIENLDFSGSSRNDRTFWDEVFPLINKIVLEHSPRINLIKSVANLIVSALSLLFFSLFIAFFQRMKLMSVISFGKTWQLIIYAMTPYVVLTLIGDLYRFPSISFLGLIISYVYANKISDSLLRNRG